MMALVAAVLLDCGRNGSSCTPQLKPLQTILPLEPELKHDMSIYSLGFIETKNNKIIPKEVVSGDLLSAVEESLPLRHPIDLRNTLGDSWPEFAHLVAEMTMSLQALGIGP